MEQAMRGNALQDWLGRHRSGAPLAIVTMRWWIPRCGSKANNRTIALDFRGENLGLFRVLFGRVLWDMNPERWGVQEVWKFFSRIMFSEFKSSPSS